MKSPNRNLLAMFFSSLVAMAGCFQIGFHYGVRPYRELLTQHQSLAVAEIAVSQSKAVFTVSLLGFASALAALAIVIWIRVKKEPIQPLETTRGK